MLKNILLISQSALRKSADRPERSNGARYSGILYRTDIVQWQKNTPEFKWREDTEEGA
jgi:hypothetical protein